MHFILKHITKSIENSMRESICISSSRSSHLNIKICLEVTKHLINCECSDITLIISYGDEVCLCNLLKLKIVPNEVGESTVGQFKVVSKKLCIQIAVTTCNSNVVGIISHVILSVTSSLKELIENIKSLVASLLEQVNHNGKYIFSVNYKVLSSSITIFFSRIVQNLQNSIGVVNQELKHFLTTIVQESNNHFRRIEYLLNDPVCLNIQTFCHLRNECSKLVCYISHHILVILICIRNNILKHDDNIRNRLGYISLEICDNCIQLSNSSIHHSIKLSDVYEQSSLDICYGSLKLDFDTNNLSENSIYCIATSNK